MSNKEELAELRAELAAVKRQLSGEDMPSEAEIAAAKNAAHQLREHNASNFNWASPDQLAAMRAACPDNVARDIVRDNRASPTVPRSIIPSSTSGNVRGPVVAPGDGTGWARWVPLKNGLGQGK